MIRVIMKTMYREVCLSSLSKGVIFLLISFLLVRCGKEKENSAKGSLAIIPYPQVVKGGNDYFTIDEHTALYVQGEGEAKQVGEYLAALLSNASSFDVAMAKEKMSSNLIILEIVPQGKKESYSIDVTPEQITIRASDAAGLFYGVQSLRQMLPVSIEVKDKKKSSWQVPTASITDEPAFTWRGMHLDVSRHFFSVDFVKKFIDRLAFYKFNTLHLHLTDDQGWRLQIKRYPELTDRGAWRVLNNQDSACLKRAEVNSDFALPQEFFREKDGVKLYGGFYTQEDIKTIVDHAASRFITIIPEIDMPGHMNAAISSFPELTCIDQGGWGKLFTTPLCPCEETTYEFITHVLTEVATLFPGEYIHIGADEVDESSWMKSPACQAMLKKNGWKSTKELHSYFVNRVNKIVTGLHKKTIGWDEIIDGVVDTSITVMYWRGWVARAPALAASRGHQVIMSPTSHCYFDYEPDERTLESMYSFDPVPAGMAEGDRKNIMGTQANIWTETIPTVARLDYLTMPRMTALSEVAWSRSKNWTDFSDRIGNHYARWDILKINYRLPDLPDLKKHVVFIDTAQLQLTLPEGVNEVRYTLDGTEPDSTSLRYEKPLAIAATTTVKLLTLGYQRRAGNRSTVHFEKQDYLPAVNEEGTLVKGLTCHYYEGEYNSVNKIHARDLKKSLVVDSIGIPSISRPSVFALEFNAFLEIPSEGIYTFYLSSDDGSTLRIGNRLVIDNDGYHSGGEVSGQIALSKGSHPVVLKYFDGGGGNSLKLYYDGPAVTKQKIPVTSWKTTRH